MRRLGPPDYLCTRWRNGGGATTQLVVEPAGAALQGAPFLYRLSIAEVANDGPFSRFDGYDRHIMLLAGAGVTLDCGAHGRIALDRPFEPRSFSGNWDVRATLRGGPVRDLNLIVDRAVTACSSLASAIVERPLALAVERDAVCLVHVVEGALDAAEEGETLIAETALDLIPRGRARVAIARVARAR